MDLKSARTSYESRPSELSELGELLRQVDATPKNHTVKGMYLLRLFEMLEGKGIEKPAISTYSFRDFPMFQYMEILLDIATTLHTEAPPREALRRLGHAAVPTFAASLLGAVIMGAVGRHWEYALKYLPKAYEVSTHPGKLTVTDVATGTATLRFREIWTFGDTYQVGVIEALLDWCGVRGHITPSVITPCDVDLKIEWRTDRA